jgi:hypothetical protein
LERTGDVGRFVGVQRAPTVVVPADPATPVKIQDSMLDTAISPTEANPRNRTRTPAKQVA